MSESRTQTLDNNDNVASAPVVIERTINAPADKVWAAISEKDRMQKWYFDLAEFKPEVGFEFQFVGGTPEQQFLHLCKVTEVIPGKKLTYSWRYDGYAGNSFVAFELLPVENTKDKTKVRLTHTGLATFPNITAFAKQNFVDGWTFIIGKSLKEYFESM